jgi:hypothetical protein
MRCCIKLLNLLFILCMIESRDVKLVEILSHSPDGKFSLRPPRVGGTTKEQVRQFSSSQHV